MTIVTKQEEKNMANLYDLKKFDLNLLIIFECIYQNLSISKAAETLYITPSATITNSIQRSFIYSFRKRHHANRHRYKSASSS